MDTVWHRNSTDTKNYSLLVRLRMLCGVPMVRSKQRKTCQKASHRHCKEVCNDELHGIIGCTVVRSFSCKFWLKR